jgi:hypothetical protein
MTKIANILTVSFLLAWAAMSAFAVVSVGVYGWYPYPFPYEASNVVSVFAVLIHLTFHFFGLAMLFAFLMGFIFRMIED